MFFLQLSSELWIYDSVLLLPAIGAVLWIQYIHEEVSALACFPKGAPCSPPPYLFPNLVVILISTVIPLFVAFALGVFLAAVPLFVAGTGCVHYNIWGGLVTFWSNVFYEESI
jgi:hypothetical protein